MKITKQQLKKIIKEELEATMKETSIAGAKGPFHPASGPLAGDKEVDVANVGGGMETQLFQAIKDMAWDKAKEIIDWMADQGSAAKAKQGTLWNADGTVRFKD